MRTSAATPHGVRSSLDGMMGVLPSVPSYQIAEAEADAPQRLALREAMSGDGPRPDAWPLFDCRLARRGGR